MIERENMSLKYGLLGLLSYTDMTGYELDKTFKESLAFFWQAQTSQIYRELNKMEATKWLSSRIEVQDDKPNKRIYSITDVGKEELLKWLCSDMPLEFMPTRSEILMRIFFSAMNNVSDSIQALKQVAKAYEEQCRNIDLSSEIIAQNSSKAKSKNDLIYWELTRDFGQAYSEMCLKWVKQSLTKLENIRNE